MLKEKLRYECDKCGSVVSADMLKDCKINIAEDVICRFCHENPKIYDKACRHRLIGIYDHLNSTSWGHIAETVFIEDNGITNPRLVVRLRYDYLWDWHWKEGQLPHGFIVTGSCRKRSKSKPVEFMYEIKRSARRSNGALMNEARRAILALHEWIDKFLT
jgi:hypothetical protein